MNKYKALAEHKQLIEETFIEEEPCDPNKVMTKEQVKQQAMFWIIQKAKHDRMLELTKQLRNE